MKCRFQRQSASWCFLLGSFKRMCFVDKRLCMKTATPCSGLSSMWKRLSQKLAHKLTNNCQTDKMLYTAKWVCHSAGLVASLVTSDTGDGQTEGCWSRDPISIRNNDSIVICPWNAGCGVANNIGTTHKSDVSCYKHCTSYVTLRSHKLIVEDRRRKNH